MSQPKKLFFVGGKEISSIRNLTEQDWQQLQKESKMAFENLSDALDQFNKNLIAANNRSADGIVMRPEDWLKIRDIKIEHNALSKRLSYNRKKRQAKATMRSRGYIAHGRHK